MVYFREADDSGAENAEKPGAIVGGTVVVEYSG